MSSSVLGRTVPSRWTCNSIFGNGAALLSDEGSGRRPASLENHGEPDRELEQDPERRYLKGERDRVDGWEQDRGTEQDHVRHPPVSPQLRSREDPDPDERDHE